MGGAGVRSKLCLSHACVKGNHIVSFENEGSGNLRFPAQPGVFSVGWCLCFLTPVAQGGGGGQEEEVGYGPGKGSNW